MRFLLLAFSFGGFLLLSSCRANFSGGVVIDSQLSAYVPADCTLLAGLDADRLTAAPFYKRHASQLYFPALNQMTEKVGVDPRRDLSSALVAWESGTPLILAKGRFSSAKLETHLESLDGAAHDYRNKKVFEMGNESLFFPQNNIAIGGSSGVVRSLIDSKPGVIAPALLNRIRAVPGSDQIWIASSQGLPLENAPIRSEVRSALSNIAAYVTAFSAGLAFDTGAHVQMDLLCDSADDARQVHDALRGGLGLARLTTKDGDLAMLKLYDAIHVTYERRTVRIQADLVPDLADQLVTRLVNFRSQ